MANILLLNPFPAGFDSTQTTLTANGSIQLYGNAVAAGEPINWASLIDGIGYNEVNFRGNGVHGQNTAQTTGFAVAAGTATVTAANNFSPGQVVTFAGNAGTLSALFNGLSFTILTATASQFTFTTTLSTLENNPTGTVTFSVDGGTATTVNVIRGEDHAYHYRSDKDCRIRTLSPLNLEKDVEFYEILLQAGGALRSAAHFEGTREFVTVQKGRVSVASAGCAEELNAGDSANYRADVPHALINAGKTESVIFLIVIYS